MSHPPAARWLFKYWHRVRLSQPTDQAEGQTSPSGAARPWAAAGCSSPVLLQEAVQRGFCPWCWRFGWICPGCWTAQGTWAQSEDAVTLIQSMPLPSGAVLWLCDTVNRICLPARRCRCGGGGEGSKVRLYVSLTKSSCRYFPCSAGPTVDFTQQGGCDMRYVRSSTVDVKCASDGFFSWRILSSRSNNVRTVRL